VLDGNLCLEVAGKLISNPLHHPVLHGGSEQQKPYQQQKGQQEQQRFIEYFKGSPQNAIYYRCKAKKTTWLRR